MVEHKYQNETQRGTIIAKYMYFHIHAPKYYQTSTPIKREFSGFVAVLFAIHYRLLHRSGGNWEL